MTDSRTRPLFPLAPRWRLAARGLAVAFLVCIPLASATAGPLHAPLPGVDAATAAALWQGRDAVQHCRPQMHEDADEYRDCVLLQATPRQASARETRAARLHRLGAAWFGWVFADLSAAASLPGADETTGTLLRLANRLQGETGVPDAALCPLAEGSCRRVLDRRRERRRLAGEGHRVRAG